MYQSRLVRTSETGNLTWLKLTISGLATAPGAES